MPTKALKNQDRVFGAAAIFKTALATARSTRKKDDYLAAARWANEAAKEAAYGSKESYWIQADELKAMAATLSEPRERQSQQTPQSLRVAVTNELHRLQSLPDPSTTQANVIRDLELVLGLTSAKQQTVAEAWKRVRKAIGH
jgi:hypothetical protein